MAVLRVEKAKRISPVSITVEERRERDNSSGARAEERLGDESRRVCRLHFLKASKQTPILILM